ncbi:HIPL1 protein-like [Phragmites australis]|uniref:HIPL1 protein-like n=1 Tax=Phragmites australis TaxID=29695 RepID=UPI002D765078|nr:HIPL1 protein-like [Phragmites australis]
MLGEALSFCGYTGVSCCDAVDDAALREEFDAMMSAPQPDAACAASTVKAALCAIRCGPSPSSNSTADWTATARSLPLLCASPPSPTSSAHNPDGDFAARSPHQGAICLERVAEGAYHGMAAHPDGSGRVFLSTQDGKIWLAWIPAHGSGGALRVNDGVSPFLDLTDRVRHRDSAAVLGLMGVAFHPEFATNGRFFVSYHTCGSSASPTCDAGRCSAATGNGPIPCRHQLVVAEFSAKGNGDYSKHGGQILFWPGDSDGYLSLIIGHGGDEEEAYGRFDSSENKGEFLGKIIGFDVDRMTGADTPEVFALGLGDPRGCSLDSERPAYLYCANVDEQQYEQVFLISNKARRNYSASSPNAFSLVIGHGRPAAGRGPSIVGGLVYRGSADPSLTGRYLYTYGSVAWAAVETPEGSGRHATTQIPNVRCSRSSPLPCHGAGGISGRVVSFGEDTSKDAFILATDGVYRVVAPGLCGGDPPPPQPSPATGLAWVLSLGVFALAFAFCMVYSTVSVGGGELIATSCNGWCGCCGSVMCCISVTNNDGVADQNGA